MKLKLSEIILTIVCLVLLWVVIFREDDPAIPSIYKQELKEQELLIKEIQKNLNKRHETWDKADSTNVDSLHTDFLVRSRYN